MKITKIKEVAAIEGNFYRDEDNPVISDDYDSLESLELLPLPIKAIAGWNIREIFGKIDGINPVELDSFSYRVTSNLNNVADRMAFKVSEISVKKAKNGKINAWIPVIKDQFRFVDIGVFTSSDWFFRDYSSSNQVELVINKLEQLFGRDIWNIDKDVSIDFDFSPSDWANFGIDSGLIDESEEFVAGFLKTIKGVRLCSGSARPQQGTRKVRSLKDAPNDPESANEVKIELFRARNWSIFGKIEFSEETARFATHTPDDKNISMPVLHQFLCAAVYSACETGEINDTFLPLSSIKKQIKDMPTYTRTNEYKLAVEEEGIPLYIPEIDNVSAYEKDYKTMGKEDKYGWSLLPQSVGWKSADDNPLKTIEERLIFTDHKTSKISFMSEGRLNIRDFDRAIPFENNHAYSMINSSVLSPKNMIGLQTFSYYANKPEFVALLPSLNNKIDPKWFEGIFVPGAVIPFGLQNKGQLLDLGKFLSEFFATHPDSLVAYIREVYSAMKDVAGMSETFDYPIAPENEWVLFDSIDILLRDINPESRILPFRYLYMYMKAISDQLLKSPNKYFEQRATNPTMKALGYATVVQKYLGDLKGVDEKQKLFRQQNDKPVISKDWVAPKQPGVDPTFEFMPHQGVIHQKLAKNPKNVMLAVDAGGGKTIIALSKMIELMDEGKISKPLIICPNNLISNYTQDMVVLNNQKYNLLPITRSTTQLHGMDRIKDLVENAPSNTIFITNYHFIKGNISSVMYGNIEIDNSENLEMLKSFQFDAAVVDESHFAKNSNTQITKSTTRLLSVIPTRYIMSGTIIDGTIIDLVAQVGMMDPTIFGNMTTFIKENASIAQGNKVLQWKQGAEDDIRKSLDENLSYIQTKRREWASLLPEGTENFYSVQLSEMQSKAYNALLDDVMTQLKGDSEFMSKLKSKDDDDSEEIEIGLQRFLAPLERFLTSPNSMLNEHLPDDEAVSPKATKAVELIEEHIKQNRKGKILVFTSYHSSADAVYDAMPDWVKEKTLLYKAENKDEFKAAFMEDDSIRVMIGVEQSLNHGHNFQNCSHLIRMEAVWNPGTLEQANSRIFRPDVKNKYGIDHKTISWIIASKTIDVTKTARLIYKMVSKARFEEKYNPNYRVFLNRPEIEYVPMSFANIAANNDFETTLSQHLDDYSELLDITKKEYIQHKEDPNTIKNNFRPPSKKMATNSAILDDIPYIENQDLPYTEQLGLVKTSNWTSTNNQTLTNYNFVGIQVHTEFGDGIVTRSSKSTLSVRLKASDAIIKGIGKTKVFVFEDQKKATKDKVETKDKIAKYSKMSLNAIPWDMDEKPIIETVFDPNSPTKTDDPSLKPIPNTDFEKNDQFNLYALSLNGQIAIGVDEEDLDVEDLYDEFERIGFNYRGPYHYAPINTKIKMQRFADFVREHAKDNKIFVPEQMMEELDRVEKLFKKGKKLATVIEKLTLQDLRNYYLMSSKKPKDPKTLHFYFTVEDEELFIIIDSTVAKRGKQFVNKKIVGIKWTKEIGDYLKIFASKSKAKDFANKLATKYTIGNFEEFKKELNTIKIRKLSKE